MTIATLPKIVFVFFSFFFFTKVYCQSNTKEDILFWTKKEVITNQNDVRP